MDKISNVKALPKVYYGLHMAPGVAEYREEGKEPYRIFIGEETIKNMDSTFSGRPVYVRHVDKVDMDTLQEDADGYVVESFYNAFDGKHWAKFIIISDKGHEAIQKGWRLSNAYLPKTFSNGGEWHGVEFAQEVTRGEYEHLAIVPNPRYEESIILTPEEFKTYNGQKELELKRLANSKKGEKPMFSFFKKEKVENAADYEKLSVVLPKSQVEVTIKNALEELDAIKNMHGYANEDHVVKVNEEEMSVKDLVNKYCAMNSEMAELKKANEEKPEEKEEKKENEEVVIEEKKDQELEEKKDADKKENSKEFFEKLKNAHLKTPTVQNLEISVDQVARGKARYGSGK